MTTVPGKPAIIAEIGWNHMGNMDLAEQMITAAAESGADFCKFQTWSEQHLVPGAWDRDGRREIYKRAELSQHQHRLLRRMCEQHSVQFLTSVFSVGALRWLKKLGLSMVKIPSHEVHNLELIKTAASNFDTIIISTGAATWKEVQRIPEHVDITKTILMHCVSAYPCPYQNVNLKRMHSLKEFGGIVGYSGHCLGIDDAMAAICNGAMFIEKHFTIDQSLPGRDNQFAILPQDMTALTSFRDNHNKMFVAHGLDFQSCEMDVHENYRGRWSNGE